MLTTHFPPPASGGPGLLNVSLALQKSSCSVTTGTPEAWISVGSIPSMSMSTTSRSWIIMSSTTPMSTERNDIGLTRCISMKRGMIGRPRSCARLRARMTGLNLSMCPTMRHAPAFSAVSRSASACCASSASGFSMRQATPALRSGSAVWWCIEVGTAMETASTPCSRSACTFVKTLQLCCSAIVAARSVSASTTPTRVTSLRFA